MRHAMGESICFAGPSPRDDKQWLVTTVLGSVTLFRVEGIKIRLGHRRSESLVNISKHAFQSACKFGSVINEALRTFAELLQLILDQSLALSLDGFNSGRNTPAIWMAKPLMPPSRPFC